MHPKARKGQFSQFINIYYADKSDRKFSYLQTQNFSYFLSEKNITRSTTIARTSKRVFAVCLEFKRKEKKIESLLVLSIAFNSNGKTRAQFEQCFFPDASFHFKKWKMTNEAHKKHVSNCSTVYRIPNRHRNSQSAHFFLYLYLTMDFFIRNPNAIEMLCNPIPCRRHNRFFDWFDRFNTVSLCK